MILHVLCRICKSLIIEYGGEIMTLCFFSLQTLQEVEVRFFNIPVDLGCLFCSLNLLVFFYVAGAVVGLYFPGQAVSRQLIISVKSSVSIK